MTSGAPKGKAFVVGAGLAGLSAATILASRGVPVTLVEAAGQAGGRCRSYFDSAMDCVIDNGNHLVLSGNRAVHAYLARIGARDVLVGPPRAEFAFVDLRGGKRWLLKPNEGNIPYWILRETRRVPGTVAGDYLKYAPLLWADKNAAIGKIVTDRGPLWERLMRPFLLAALNTEPEESSAVLAGQVLRETLARGGRHYRPRIAHPTLAAAFVDPALDYLKAKGATVQLSTRLRGITLGRRNILAMDLGESAVPLTPNDAIVLAVPPWAAKDLIPTMTTPDDFRAIVNAHFKMPAPISLENGGAPAMLGVIGGTAEWIFTFPDRISVTVSGADAIVDQDREDLAIRIWADVSKALDITAPMPQWQIVKEKRATFAATPVQDAKRPGARTGWPNLFLAGDWTQTGLPATIEGALRSGETAAALALQHLSL